MLKKAPDQDIHQKKASQDYFHFLTSKYPVLHFIKKTPKNLQIMVGQDFCGGVLPVESGQ